MDLEGLANRLLEEGKTEDEIVRRLEMEISIFRDPSSARKLAKAVLEEVKNAKVVPDDEFIRRLLVIPQANATMHDLGVGCRGSGDFFVHQLLSDMIQGSSLIPPESQDDAGAVDTKTGIIVASVDGTHSRLSDFPFIAGFHVARAAIRDVVVKGARAVAMVDDVHLGDDGDVGKLFDFVAGVEAVSRLARVPLIAGSTLRVGGDMVIGNRMVSGVGCVGLAKKLLRRVDIKEGDVILMTSGAGGGTIATTAIYSGHPDVVKETINMDFIRATSILLKTGLMESIHAMSDVTNGGLRGDANEICHSAGVGMEFWEDRIKRVVNHKILDMLSSLGIDYLGVSLDSLLVFCPKRESGEIMESLRRNKVIVEEVGRVVRGNKAVLDGRPFAPRFRESAYTRIKQIVGEKKPVDEERFQRGAVKAAREAKKKMEEVIEYVKKSAEGSGDED